MQPQYPLHRFEEFGALTAKEREVVATLGGAPRAVPRGRLIRAEGVATDGFFLLVSGWAAASHIIPDGRRQILKIHLPGDVLGTPSMAMDRAVEELTALTDVIVLPVTFARFGSLFDEHPRIAARFTLSFQRERVALMDRLVSIGRTSADARVAAFILDLVERLEPLKLVDRGSFDIVVTQEQIADVIGLTPVHVNRMLRLLTEQGMIRRTGHRMTILDREGLSTIALRPERRLAVDNGWLPAPR